MRQRLLIRALSMATLVAGAGLASCSDDDLIVGNENAPDVGRVFGTPPGVETVISRVFQQLHQGQYGTSSNVWTQSNTMSFENSSQLGNFGMGTRGQIPRNPIDNGRGNAVEDGNFRDFDHLSRNARLAANAISALNAFAAGAGSFAQPARQARAKSFAFFALGYAHGQLAMLYDSAAIITWELKESIEFPPLSPYGDVAEAALSFLDSALALANSPAAAGEGGWPIPNAWMGMKEASVPQINLARWLQIVRSYKARYRAGVARNPADRANVDWDEIIADATNGIQANIVVDLDPNTTGWSNSWGSQHAVPGAWHQMTPFIIGMADTAGAYDTWLATSLMQRAPFLIRTPDRRFPSGDTRAVQQTRTATSAAGLRAVVYTAFPYFRNRPSGEDTPAEPWGTSFYDNYRFRAIRANNGVSAFPIMTRAEVDMLAAEGYLRQGAVASATPLIDRYRTAAGLPSVAGITDLTTAVPGPACVPRVPQPPNFTSTACGNIFEAMKWEKRMETHFTGYAQWFIDSRGWGDLAQGTTLMWPVPYQEMDARGQAFYSSNVIPNNAAARGTYGF